MPPRNRLPAGLFRGHAENHVELHRGPEGQLCGPGRGSGVASSFAEQLDQQVRGCVDHLGLLGEGRSRTHETLDPLDRDDAIEMDVPRSSLTRPDTKSRTPDCLVPR